MCHLVLISNCIPTSQDYQIDYHWVMHCAWHHLNHHYLSVLATFLGGGGREEIYPVVPARLLLISWSDLSILLTSGFQMLGHLMLQWGIFKKEVSTWKTFSSIHACCFSVYRVSFFVCFFILQYRLSKWPQPNSQWVIGVNCNWRLLWFSCMNEERIQYITVGADSNFEFDQKVWLGHLNAKCNICE